MSSTVVGVKVFFFLFFFVLFVCLALQWRKIMSGLLSRENMCINSLSRVAAAAVAVTGGRSDECGVVRCG